MAFTSWRGVIGCINPTMRPGVTEELVRILPEGIGVIPLHIDIREGKTETFRRAVSAYEPEVARLAEAGVDLILPVGAPPFMMLGPEGEAKLISEWEERYKVPIFTSGQNHIRAMKALGVKRFVGSTYVSGDPNEHFAKYFRDAGFDVLGMEGMDVPFEKAQGLSAYEVYAHIKRGFLRHPEAEAIYLLGSGWRVREIVDMLEQDLGVPVIHPVATRCWEIQLRLHIRQPVPNFGQLLRDMPRG